MLRLLASSRVIARRCGLGAAVLYVCLLTLLALGHQHDGLERMARHQAPGPRRASHVGPRSVAWLPASHACPACAWQRDGTATPTSRAETPATEATPTLALPLPLPTLAAAILPAPPARAPPLS